VARDLHDSFETERGVDLASKTRHSFDDVGGLRCVRQLTRKGEIARGSCGSTGRDEALGWELVSLVQRAVFDYRLSVSAVFGQRIRQQEAKRLIPRRDF